MCSTDDSLQNSKMSMASTTGIGSKPKFFLSQIRAKYSCKISSKFVHWCIIIVVGGGGWG